MEWSQYYEKLNTETEMTSVLFDITQQMDQVLPEAHITIEHFICVNQKISSIAEPGLSCIF